MVQGIEKFKSSFRNILDNMCLLVEQLATLF